jgi:hypothetical protein
VDGEDVRLNAGLYATLATSAAAATMTHLDESPRTSFTPVRPRSTRYGRDMSPGRFQASKDQVGRAGELFVAAEIHRRGGYAVTFSGNMPGIDILASDVEHNQRITIQVKTKGPGSKAWQTSIHRGRPQEEVPKAEAKGRFWILVDLRAANPEFYVMPEWWIRDDIYVSHRDYLARHGGVRPGKNPGSTHHAIPIGRVLQWKDSWSALGILKSAFDED